MTEKALAMPQEIIENKIFLVRGKNVLFDRYLAVLYGVETKALNRAVKRNIDRFPEGFMFQLSKEELANLRFHFGTSNRGGQRHLLYAFTENGVGMLSSVYIPHFNPNIPSPQAGERARVRGQQWGHGATRAAKQGGERSLK